jgi:glycosyltransferase involved in cell wall biosynthesis
MKFLIFWKKLRAFFVKLILLIMGRPKISILIPFSSKDPYRKATFEWLLEYWRCELPFSEIIIGESTSEIFCKGEALNNAASKATGKVLVIMDADAFIKGEIIEYCADRIIEELDNHLWYVPYRRLYRMTKDCTERIIDSNPCLPARMTSPPPDKCIENIGHTSKYGHRYGAMCMMFPREALDTIGGFFDERFKGWGGEDVALLRALDTLYGKHKTTNNDILHLWHPFIGDNYKTRKWEGQTVANPNSKLAMRYHQATRHPSKMKDIMNEAVEYYNNKNI